ncbi:hypothetical protein ElyMa_002765300 [Elysia marginata]|uniref:Mutator-like transposase domain-containing protein n=1 Tax=Elysia marginata TaxID=1093978 RepID=A0AAV4HK49_9GAST|nr:hypothetical protein ElyMa_002765300 [Elysia marginata]
MAATPTRIPLPLDNKLLTLSETNFDKVYLSTNPAAFQQIKPRIMPRSGSRKRAKQLAIARAQRNFDTKQRESETRSKSIASSPQPSESTSRSTSNSKSVSSFAVNNSAVTDLNLSNSSHELNLSLDLVVEAPRSRSRSPSSTTRSTPISRSSSSTTDISRDLESRSRSSHLDQHIEPSHSSTPENVDLDIGPCRTSKKLKLAKDSQPKSAVCTDGGRTIVDINNLKSLFTFQTCPECQAKSLTLKEGRWVGLAVQLKVCCLECDSTLATAWTSEKDTTGHGFTINRTAVYSSLQAGFGAVRHNLWCENMGIPSLHHKTFQKHASKIYKETPFLRRKIFLRAAKIVRQQMSILHAVDYSEDDIIDIAVSYDASWLTRGHTSHIGVCCIIEITTGYVLDCHVLSTYCHKCEHHKTLKENDPKAYAAWHADHLEKKECDANFFGTSGMMEVHGARVLWGRSVNSLRLRYTTMLSDGDCKSYTALQNLRPYGDDIEIDKEECVNHVGKRLGAALRNLVSDSSKRGITLGGRGKGRLTANAIRKLQIYYARGILNNSNAADMQRAIMASIYHCFSTDSDPTHHLCPPGQDSWCHWQSSIAQHKEPAKHKDFVHTPLDKNLLKAHLEPIYTRLANINLLKRCERKATQNANESLHSVIWARCPKDRFSSRPKVEHAVITAICNFNFGPTEQHAVTSILGVIPQASSIALSEKRLARRIRNNERKMNAANQHRRKKRAEAKRKLLEELERAEGGPSYKAGAF